MGGCSGVGRGSQLSRDSITKGGGRPAKWQRLGIPLTLLSRIAQVGYLSYPTRLAGLQCTQKHSPVRQSEQW